MKKNCINFILIFLLSASIFSHKALAIDGVSVLNEETIVAGYLDWGYLYKNFIDSLKNINKPEHAGTKSFLDHFYKRATSGASAKTDDQPFENCAKSGMILVGAIEMYDMDHKDRLKHLDLETLKKEGYIRNIPVCPSNGVYSYDYDQYKIICSKHGDVRNPTPHDDDVSPGSLITAKTPAEAILELHSRSIFYPQGKIWFSINNYMQPRLILEGSFKPVELIETIKSLIPGFPEAEILQKNLVRFSIPKTFFAVEKLIVEIVPGAIKIGSDFSADIYNKGWQELISSAQSKKMKLAIEFSIDKLLLHAKKITQKERLDTCLGNIRILQAACGMFGNSTGKVMKNLDQDKLIAGKCLRFPVICPDQGNYSISGNINQSGVVKCSVHGTNSKPELGSVNIPASDLPDPRLKYLANIRLLLSKTDLAVKFKITDSNARNELRSKLEKPGKDAIDTSGIKSLLPEPLQGIANVEKDAQVIEKGEWIELFYDRLGLDFLISSLTGVK
ncbi:MAG: hypothetical protein ACQETH_03140 [Candidatus Rifleibacteriota bacterium]